MSVSNEQPKERNMGVIPGREPSLDKMPESKTQEEIKQEGYDILNEYSKENRRRALEEANRKVEKEKVDQRNGNGKKW